MEKNITIQQALFFSSLKKPRLKDKKIINISYLVIMLIKIRLLIFLVLSRYGLSYKYGITSKYQYIWLDAKLHFLIPDMTIIN